MSSDHEHVPHEVRAAYLQYLKQGEELLGEVPGATFVKADKVEMVPDARLAKYHSGRDGVTIKGAYRASASVIRAFYFDLDHASISPTEMQRFQRIGQFPVAAPYQIFTRGKDVRGSDDYYREEFVDPAWKTLEERQLAPVDSLTGKALPTHWCFNRAIITFPYGNNKTSISDNETSNVMKSWLSSHQIGVRRRDGGVVHTWTQLAPIPGKAMKATDVWNFSRRVYLRLDIGDDSYIICSQIARLPNGTYVPWKKTEQKLLEKEPDYYHEYEYDGPIPEPLNLPLPPVVGSSESLHGTTLPPPPSFDFHREQHFSSSYSGHPYGSFGPPPPPVFDTAPGPLSLPPFATFPDPFPNAPQAFLPPPPPPPSRIEGHGQRRAGEHLRDERSPRRARLYYSLNHRHQIIYGQIEAAGGTPPRF
ncbi:uncharacterized protein JCM6883_002251 [Sporobolomyces salmoneus]|uniref:uncharacterized protein n=1 Tax=Sporobolomyces salmoneus TaxID=183962 RepID=UPI003172B029